ncbi:MAG: 5'-nucleotidase C-terminal domain-containing protein [Clostridiales bacterium]|nr:5'-nucleotidase C-terminal domain-containing protein [Candidatus Crickella equi]
MKKTNRWLAILLALALVITMLPMTVFATTAKSDNIVILATSDIHANVGADTAGFKGLRSIQQEMKSQYKNVVMVDNGDSIQGGSGGFLTKGTAVVKLINAIKYDVIVPGNHDFDYGVDYFLKDIASSIKSAQIVSCNFRRAGDDGSYFKPYAIKKYGDIKVAFVGITTPETLTKSKPTNWYDEKGNKKYDFYGANDGKELQAQVQKSVDAARAAGANYVIALGHLGKTGDTANPWKSQDIIANTSGIDAFIDGHDHLKYSDSVKNVNGKEVPRIAIGTKIEAVGKIEIKTDGTISVDVIEEFPTESTDTNFDALIKEINDEIGKITSQKIGTSKYNLITHDADGNRLVRKQETNLGDFCADAIRTVMGSDIGIVNGGALRTDLKKGTITRGNILDIFPFGNMMCECEASGQEILDALELSAMNVGKSEFGGFLQVSGMTYCINPNIDSPVVLDEDSNFVKVDGARRVYNVKVGGQPINPTKTYTLACHNFKLKSGGDGYTMFKDNKFIQDEVILDSELLMEYIKKNLNGEIGSRYAKSQKRIFIGSKEEYEAAVQKENAETREKLVIAEYEPQLKANAAKKSAKLSWNKCDSDGVTYKVYRKQKNGKYKQLAKTTKTSYTVKKLSKGKTYKFKVRASKQIGEEAYNGHYSQVVKCKAR